MSRRIALIVGISQYDFKATRLNNLSAPVNDAQKVYALLHQYGNFDALYPLPLAKDRVGESGEVTTQLLINHLQNLFNPPLGKEVELAVFYFSGHGVKHQEQTVYLSATDNPFAIAIHTLLKLASNSPVQNIGIWLDCCHSGEILEFTDLDDKGFCVVAASTANEGALSTKEYSLLTRWLCQALEPTPERPEVQTNDFINHLQQLCKNLPQQVLQRGNKSFILTRLQTEHFIKTPYPIEHRPYKGLQAFSFSQEDKDFFFGRESFIQQLHDKLKTKRLIAVLGASGSGKSSLVLAGLLPELNPSDWQILIIHPHTNPIQSLRDAFVRLFPKTQLPNLLTAEDLIQVIQGLIPAKQQLLLVIDQFEEIFTQCKSETERSAWFVILLGTIKQANALHIILTLRADFLGHCLEYPELGQTLHDNTLLLTAPHAHELRDIITCPLKQVGMTIEAKLTDELMAESLDEKGSLPLLQYVLDKLWQSTRDHYQSQLTWKDYDDLGGNKGLRGILNQKADAFLTSLPIEQQRLMEWLMVELTQVGDGQDDTRRTVTLQELHNRQPQYTAALDALLAQLVTHERLLTQDHDDHGQATITVAHEALIRDWQRLRNWLESNREIKSWRNRLEDSIAAWKNGVSGSLLREKRLAEAQQIIGRNPDSLLIGQDERAFIAASQTEEKQRKRAKTQLVVLIMALLFIGIFVTTWQWRVADQQRLEANRQTKIALVGKLASQAELATRSHSIANGWITQGLLLALQAFRIDSNSPLALSALKNGYQNAGHLQSTMYTRDHLLTVTFSPDSKLVVGGSSDGMLQLWDVATEQQVGEPWLGHEDGVNSVAFSPNGKFVISGSDDKTLRLWNTKTGQQVGKPWLGHEDGVRSVAFSPDGKFVISGSNDKTLRLWDTATRQQVGKSWLGHEKGVNSVAFSHDGRLVISIDDHNLYLWSVITGMVIGNPWDNRSSYSYEKSIVFSNDDQFVFSSGDDSKSLRLWNVRNGQPIDKHWNGHESWVRAIAYSPNGKFIASTASDRTLRLWNIETNQVWPSYKMPVSSIAIASNGQYMVSGGYNNKIQLWNINTKQPIGNSWQGHNDNVSSLAFSPNGQYVISGSNDTTIRLWDVTTRKAVGEAWQGHTKPVMSVAFSPDGKNVISGSLDNTLRFWDITTGSTVKDSWQGHKSQVLSVAFSPNGKFVISGSDDKTLRLWDTKTGRQVGEPWLGHEDGVRSVAFSPDGKFVVSGSGDETLRLWDAKTGQQVGESWLGHEGGVNSVTFSPNGKYVISGSEDQTIRLWDVTTGKSIGEAWQGHEFAISTVAFSPNGEFVISATHNLNIAGTVLSTHTIRLWDVDPESWAKKACSIVNRNFSLAEWQRFIGDTLPYQKTCPDLPAPGEEGWVEPYAGE